jgi:hypothetical protein
MRLALFFISLLALSPQCIADVTITTPSLPNGTVGAAYSATIAAAGGCSPYTWTIIGTLPAGITSSTASDPTSTTLNGTPTTAGAYSFTAQVKGCGGHISSASYTVVIQPAPVPTVDLSWNASTSPEIAGYNVYRGPDGVKWRMINDRGLIASTLYTDSTVKNGATYFYAVAAVNTSREESAKSTPVEVVIP